VTASTVYFIPSSQGSIVVTVLRGGGPGLNLDSSTFSFQVPNQGGGDCARKVQARRRNAGEMRTIPRIVHPVEV